MSLSIGLPASFVSITGSAGTTAAASRADAASADDSPALASGATQQAEQESGSGLGEVVDTLLDRLSDLHERLQRLRQELRTALRSLQPDVVRLPRILSLQREIMITNSDIQLVSGLLVTTLNDSSTGISTRA